MLTYLDAGFCGLSLTGGGVGLNKPGSFILPATSVLRSLASDFSSKQRNKCCFPKWNESNGPYGKKDMLMANKFLSVLLTYDDLYW